MIETVIVEALEDIPGLSGKIFPLGASEKTELPFVVYISDGSTEDDSLSGWIGSYSAEMEINVLHGSYKAMKSLAAQVAAKIKTITDVSLTISEDDPEVYEQRIKAYRKAIHIKIMF